LTRSRRIQARFTCADVQSICVEVLALVLTRIGEISTIEHWIFASTTSTTTDLEINAAVVVAQGKGSSEPRPLESPLTIRQVFRDSQRRFAGSARSISRSAVSSIRISSIIRSTSTNFVTNNFLYTVIKCRVAIRLVERSPS